MVHTDWVSSGTMPRVPSTDCQYWRQNAFHGGAVFSSSLVGQVSRGNGSVHPEGDWDIDASSGPATLLAGPSSNATAVSQLCSGRTLHAVRSRLMGRTSLSRPAVASGELLSPFFLIYETYILFQWMNKRQDESC